MITAITEQMRALADRADACDDIEDVDAMTPELTAAIRAAADQLDAATALISDVGSQRDYWADRAAAVERVADMAQDDENGSGWVPVEPLLDALYPERRNSAD